MVPLKVDECLRVEHVLLMECVRNIPRRYYLAELPLIDNDIRHRLRIYENLVN
jgi:hypothetical protein